MPQARDKNITQESFDAILEWLDPDRERAAVKYEELRRALIRILGWHSCADPEGLADEVMDRVASKVFEVKPNYVGDPRLYFYAVANHLVKETKRKSQANVSLDDVQIPANEFEETPDDVVGQAAQKCFQKCLKAIPAKNRKLIINYYQKERRAKINNRRDLAGRLNVVPNTLRVRVHRIRVALNECIEKCMAENK
jgi:DNA-directed RNA polymerase specialized sigma24 family protein